MCNINDGLLPFICGATISAGISTMLEASFIWQRFISGFCMFLASAFVFWWYVCLSETKQEIAKNESHDQALFMSDRDIWEKHHSKRRVTMKVLVVLTIVSFILFGIFLCLSYLDNPATTIS